MSMLVRFSENGASQLMTLDFIVMLLTESNGACNLNVYVEDRLVAN